MIPSSAETAPPSSAASAAPRLNPPTSSLLAKKQQPPRQRASARIAERLSQTSPPHVISGRWLACALLGALFAAVICAYAALCLLVYQGQWQLVLHPSAAIARTPASQGLKFDDIRFDYTETGSPRLDGWWVPADTDARWSASTILYLHGGDGSLSGTVDDLGTLHSIGINVFAFDYRGYGRSAGPKPREKHMREDAEAAWSYLSDTRHIAPKSIVIYGSGIGASLAADLAVKHTPAGLILDGPSEPARQIIGADARARIVPGFLITERFDPGESLQTLTMPKLFLDRNGAKSRTSELYKAGALPKEYFELGQGAFEPTLRRFLDEVLP
jgi:pimeloyl-ACP methyl ester carboxylesterase